MQVKKNLPHAQVFCLNEMKNLHTCKKKCGKEEEKKCKNCGTFFLRILSTHAIDYEAKLASIFKFSSFSSNGRID